MPVSRSDGANHGVQCKVCYIFRGLDFPSRPLVAPYGPTRGSVHVQMLADLESQFGGTMLAIDMLNV
jgi:hypothetical protein